MTTTPNLPDLDSVLFKALFPLLAPVVDGLTDRTSGEKALLVQHIADSAATVVRHQVELLEKLAPAIDFADLVAAALVEPS